MLSDKSQTQKEVPLLCAVIYIKFYKMLAKLYQWKVNRWLPGHQAGEGQDGKEERD